MDKSVIKPTEGELEILTVLWDKGKATVKDVHQEIIKTKDSGYTTTLKLMQIMFEKALVNRDSSRKVHIYEAAVSKEKTQENIVNRMIKNVFSGNPTNLVLQALDCNKTTDEELTQIEEFIKTLKSKK